MKYCSLCNNPYSDDAKNCSLSHCVSCGSTRLHTDKSKQVNPIALIFVVAIFAIIFWALIFDKMEQIAFIIVLFGMFMIIVLTEGYSSRTVYLCLNCLAKGFTPIIKVPLQDTRIDERQKGTLTGVSPDDISKLIKDRISFKTKFDLRTGILIIGVAIAIIALIFGDTISRAVDSIFS